MIKTIFATRFDENGKEYIDMRASAKWPSGEVMQVIDATLALQGKERGTVAFEQAMVAAGYEEAVALARRHSAMEMRARANLLTLHIVCTEAEPTDKELIRHAKDKRNARRRRV